MRFIPYLTLACMIPSLLHAQDPPTPKPTKQHEIYKQDVGTWKGQMKIYMEGPDAKPTVFPATETCELWGHGFWLLTSFESGPYQGRGQFGYDPRKKKYVGTWADNMSPHMTSMEGHFDAEKKTMVMHSKGFDPQTGKVENTKSESKHITKDERSFVMYAKKGDAWVKSFEIELKRDKD